MQGVNYHQPENHFKDGLYDKETENCICSHQIQVFCPRHILQLNAMLLHIIWWSQWIQINLIQHINWKSSYAFLDNCSSLKSPDKSEICTSCRLEKLIQILPLLCIKPEITSVPMINSRNGRWLMKGKRVTLIYTIAKLFFFFKRFGVSYKQLTEKYSACSYTKQRWKYKHNRALPFSYSKAWSIISTWIKHWI